MEIKQKAQKIEKGLEEEVKRHKFFFFWDPVIIYFVLIIIISNWPRTPTPELAMLGFVVSDKIKHVILYFGFSFLLGVACRHSNFVLLRQNHFFIALTAASLVGILDEVNQLRVIGRHFGADEIGFNIMGSILGQGVRGILRLQKSLLRRIF